MNFKLLTAVIAAAFVTVSGASWAQVAAGGNTVPKYGNVEASKNKKVVNHGVGGNSAPSYPAAEASKNRKGPSTALAAMLSRPTQRSVRTKPELDADAVHSLQIRINAPG
jgi:hypothetical protein